MTRYENLTISTNLEQPANESKVLVRNSEFISIPEVKIASQNFGSTRADLTINSERVKFIL